MSALNKTDILWNVWSKCGTFQMAVMNWIMKPQDEGRMNHTSLESLIREFYH